MKHLAFLSPLLFLCASCSQNQLILEPIGHGQSLMVCDLAAITEFESLMAGIATPENEHKLPANTKDFFDSPDILSTTQDTQPILGVSRLGDKEYYYHIERDRRGNLITDLDQGVIDYEISKETYARIQDFIKRHSPVRQEAASEEDKLNEADFQED